MNRIRNTKAFTLIELVVVIVILGILAAIAAFAYQSFISSSRQSATDRKADQAARSLSATAGTKQVAPSALTEADVIKSLDSDLGNGNTTIDATDDYTSASGTVTVENGNCTATINLTAVTSVGGKIDPNDATCTG